ncbi:MAG: trypsin-like peptidase domain-containing protein [Christensenella sp.]|nr:trypsin-like peptidase domain-containing protein [Christensenella sp.]
MESNGFYSSDHKHHDSETKGGNTFATVVIIVVILLLALMVIGLFWPRLLGVSPTDALINATPTPHVTQQAEVTPTPEPGATAAPENTQAPASEPSAIPEPTATPVVRAEDRVMPSLDGVVPALPALPGYESNPIPDIYDAVSPGVVGVLNYTQAQGANGKTVDALYGSGTGFVVSSAGYILTNAHVVDGASKITVQVYGEENERDAILIGSDTETDIAVLKVNNASLHPLVLGDSDQVRVGEYVLAIGNPLSTDELANTITYGIISANKREVTIDNYTNTYLQTDAAINFGNSGGPLINMKGEVIGINSAKTVTAGYDAMGNAVSAEGIGFALPINQVQKIMQVLITKGYIERPGIGITVSTVTADMAEATGVPAGALVESVVKGKPADLAGVLAGDIILEANGEKIATHKQLVNLVLSCMIGDELKIKVYRDGQTLDLTIVIGNKTDMNFNDIVGGATPMPIPDIFATPAPN